MNKQHSVLHASGNGSMNESCLSQTGDAEKSRQAGTIQVLLQDVLSSYDFFVTSQQSQKMIWKPAFAGETDSRDGIGKSHSGEGLHPGLFSDTAQQLPVFHLPRIEPQSLQFYSLISFY
ncbi:hypothetical protein [Desulfonatronum parangueonense]